MLRAAGWRGEPHGVEAGEVKKRMKMTHKSPSVFGSLEMTVGNKCFPWPHGINLTPVTLGGGLARPQEAQKQENHNLCSALSRQ